MWALSLLLPLLLSSLMLPLWSRSATAQIELNIESFLQRLEATYSRIHDLDAVVHIFTSGPQEQEKAGVLLRVQALLQQRVLRIEYLAPAEMRGQFYTLKDNILSQYMPVTNLVIIQEITEKHILYPLLQSLNFNLQQIVRQLEHQGFRLEITQTLSVPGEGLPLSITIARLSSLNYSGISTDRSSIGLASLSIKYMSIRKYKYKTEAELAISLRVSEIELGDYFLEAILPKEQATESEFGFRVSRELIWMDPVTLLPRRVETHLLQKMDDKWQEREIIAVLKSIKINQGLTEEELLAVPRDAQILDRRGKP